MPSVRFKCWENAKSESFYARDNAENFIRWCRKFGVHEAVIFESDGLGKFLRNDSISFLILFQRFCNHQNTEIKRPSYISSLNVKVLLIATLVYALIFNRN